MKFFKVIFLYPISLIYAFAVNIRNTLFDLKFFKSEEFDLPVISVGNITVGGTGKTPVTEYLINALRKKYKIAVLSRGYKRKTKGFVLADIESDVNTIGDEPFQIKQKFPEIILAVDEKRSRGIKRLQELEEKPDLVILDDAFQHRHVKPGLSILLIDYTQPFFEDYFLPLGRLRDNPKEKHRAHIILVTKAPSDIKPIDMRIMATNLELKAYQTLFFTSFIYKYFYPVYKNVNKKLKFEEVEKTTVLLVTGIGNHKQMVVQCNKFAKEIIHLKFKDHHKYTEKDIKTISERYKNIDSDNKIILTTEKDAGKIKNLMCDEEIKNKMFYCPVEIKILNNEKEIFEERVFTYIKKDEGQYRFLTSRRQY